MKNNISTILSNSIELDKNSVWVLSGHSKFDYSDGFATEAYLRKVLNQVEDLSSVSYELERWIVDWVSEYHLSRKRTQLLRGFSFDKTKRVLEVGCGCGAITRFLGETFDRVVSIEGSLERAKIARLRTKDLPNVSIICAPFQDVKFIETFDVIFCVGVFEYSAHFVDGSDPYDTIMKYFRKILSPDGVIVLAIENQFGLKYFSSSSEDHTNRMFEGIEGYPYYKRSVRTFGYDEIKARLTKYFAHCDFYFPYPDYKIPSCVLSEDFIGQTRAGELVGQFNSRDYACVREPLFDESLAYLELDKNNKLPFFSNSFLIFAGEKRQNFPSLGAMGILFGTDRAEKFQAITKFIEYPDRSIWTHKTPIAENHYDPILTLHPVVSKWQSGLSLQCVITQRARDRDMLFDELFIPCKAWLNTLTSNSVLENGLAVVHGRYIDCIWRNSYVYDDNCFFIDQEWEWNEKISVNVLVIRAIYCFLNDLPKKARLHPSLVRGSTTSLIKDIGQSIGILLHKSNFKEFSRLESKFYSIVSEKSYRRIKMVIDLFLWNKSVVALLYSFHKKFKKIQILKQRVMRYIKTISLL